MDRGKQRVEKTPKYYKVARNENPGKQRVEKTPKYYKVARNENPHIFQKNDSGPGFHLRNCYGANNFPTSKRCKQHQRLEEEAIEFSHRRRHQPVNDVSNIKDLKKKQSNSHIAVDTTR
ncbi:hypothetical protein QE152_g951 [Popillia japonica]|uniref:Uncharacterized protein n=1 Tax=Popillia japonica TaxID=7064 RepID=A0AAW1N9S5_POPJA